jgi:DNA-binding FadR family transcriptional regulator
MVRHRRSCVVPMSDPVSRSAANARPRPPVDVFDGDRERGPDGATDGGRPGARSVSLVDRVYEEILRLILDGGIPEGGRLPTEARFCALFSVSRTVVRAALARLRIDGVVASRQGQGSVVLRRPNRGVLDVPTTGGQVGSIADMQRFFEFRQLVEGEIAALAAERRGADDLARLRAACDAVATALAGGGMAITEDVDFHLAVAAAAHNKFLAAALVAARESFVEGIRFARALSAGRVARRGEGIVAEHARVLAAIVAGDAVAARAAMVAHLARTRDRVFLGD